MATTTKQAIIDRLVALLEVFGATRIDLRDIRREMKSKTCTARTADEPAPCFHQTDGRTPWCENCRDHDVLFRRLLHVRKEQSKRFLQIERLSIKLAMPEPVNPPEPRLLLEAIEAAEAEEHQSCLK